MKRCPQCDFIYEDYQGLCDMDGSELVSDGGAQPFAEETAMQPWRPPTRPRRGGLAALLVAAGILGAVLLTVSFVSPQRAAPPGAKHPPLKVNDGAQAAPEPLPAAPAATPTPSPAPSPSADAKATHGAPPTAKPKPLASSTPSLKGETRKLREGKTRKPEGEGGKKESKLGSALKKAGRVLKKPFKL
jgi:hypothetical protein